MSRSRIRSEGLCGFASPVSVEVGPEASAAAVGRAVGLLGLLLPPKRLAELRDSSVEPLLRKYRGGAGPGGGEGDEDFYGTPEEHEEL